jgi:1,4-dihydroxy-2-naphthoate octaprenyltransferase
MAYLGLGDLFVFVYFGLVATLMAPFLYLSSEKRNDTLNKVLWKLIPYAVQVVTLATSVIISVPTNTLLRSDLELPFVGPSTL